MFGVDNTFLSRAVDAERLRALRSPSGLAGARPALRRRSSPAARRPRSTTATCASTTTRRGSPSKARPAGRPRGPRPNRPTRACSWSRTRRPRRPAWPSCWPRSPSTATTAGSTTGTRCAHNGVEVVDSWDDGLLRRVLRRRGDGTSRSSSATPAARRPRSCSPTPIRPDRADDGHRRHHVLPPGRVRRRAARHDARGRGARSSSTSCSAQPFQAELPLNLFVYPVERRRRPARGVHRQRRRPADPATMDPATIAANREDVARRRGPTPSCAEPTADERRCGRVAARRRRPVRSVRVARAWRVAPVAFLAVFYAWPFATLLAPRACRRSPSRDTLGRPVDAAGRLVHAVAGRRQHRADDRHRAGPGLRDRPLPLPGPAPAAGAADRAVRAADGRDGRGRARPAARRAGSAGVPAILARPRVLQPRRRRAHRRRARGPTSPPTSRPPPRRSAPRRGGRSARSRCRCCARPSLAAGVDRLRVHVHLVRRDPRARRARHPTIEVEVWRRADAARRPAHRRRARRRCSCSPSARRWRGRHACSAAAAAGALALARRPPRADAAPGASARSSPPSPSPRRSWSCCRSPCWSSARSAAVDALAHRLAGAAAGASTGPGAELPGHRPAGAVGTSLRTPLSATVIAVVVGGVGGAGDRRRPAGGRLLDTGLMLPIATSAVTIGFGVLITFDQPPVDLRGSWWPCPSARPSSPSRSSCARCCPCCGPSTPICARRRPRSAPRRRGRGGRSTSRSCAAPSASAPGSPPRSRSASSAPRASCPAPVRDHADRHRPAARAARRRSTGPGLRARHDPRRRRPSSCSPSTACASGAATVDRR